MLKHILSDIFEFFLPRSCVSCEKKLFENENVICPLCLTTLSPASDERNEIEFSNKFFNKKFIENSFSKFVFEKEKGLQKIIHELKYRQRFNVGIYLGELTGEALKKYLDEWMIDLIIPVPLHPAKKAERGYNQSDYIAKGVSAKLNIPYSTKIIKRKKHTVSQTKLDSFKRESNVQDAFSIKNRKKIHNKNILLIDDVITTGATINSCGEILKKEGANIIFAASVAVADID